jgi:Asp-tRNA(Asn)/Glu-tRNA(Gln) amidotransferase A subunit family amidase
VTAIRDLAAKVRGRELSARELVSESLRRIEELDPELNAVVTLRAAEALDDATGLDETIAVGGEVGPLAGLPLLVKDMTDVAGMRTTFGSLAFEKAQAASADALVVARLRAAGAVVVGRTNLPEFAIEGYTSNLLWGTTRNPWNRERTTGGSSGGSAAALAAGMAAIATATDGGGSIRIPAAYCGLVGIKPTNGVIGRDPNPDWIDYSTDGPFSPHVDDVRLLLDVLRGPVPGDPTALPAPVPVGDLQVGQAFVVPHWSGVSLEPAVAALLDDAVGRFAALFGVEPESRPSPELFDDEPLARGHLPGEDWFIVCPAEHAHRFGRSWLEAHLDELHPASQEFLTEGLSVTIDDYLAARRRRFAYTRAVDRLLGSDRVILQPVMAVDATSADGPGGASTADWYVTDAQNITGHPAISLPAGVHPSGVPFGFQVTGPRFREDLLLEIAARWEEVHPWSLAAPGYEPFAADLSS